MAEVVPLAKVKSKRGRAGYVFFKELGGAPRRIALSKTARVLAEAGLVRGQVLDHGCGLGFDAGRLGWEAYDPYYRPAAPAGPYDTRGSNRPCDSRPAAPACEIPLTPALVRGDHAGGAVGLMHHWEPQAGG
jgi:hypothetical protein